MRSRTGEMSLSPHSPVRVFALVMLAVFSVEGAIMLCLPELPSEWHGSLLEGLLDASLLALITAPAVWFLAVLPLRRLFEARGHLLQRLFESQEQERANVARDLHDGVGQHLTALMVGLRNVEAAGDLPSAQQRARELREYAAEAHGEVRRLARGLRPVVLEEFGLVPAIERSCEEFERTCGVKVVVQCNANQLRRIERGAETALYRIVQEALANVARHADATRVEVGLAQDAASTHLTIRDDGCGFDAEEATLLIQGEGSFGLGSIRERVLMMNGELSIRTGRGKGTSIRIRVPSAS